MKIVTTVGGNLFEIASEQLGSALQWINIARANKISDPFLSGPAELLIPSFSSDLADGIGPQ
jgi:hypothetical protein